MADPEIHEQLPLARARWVVSSVRSKELSVDLLRQLRTRGYVRKVAVTAASHQEADELEQAGAHLVFRPFDDAAEQAVDALTYAMDVFPENIDWPVAFRDVRIRTDASAAGQSIRDIPLRLATGVSIAAVSRAGQFYYDPNPDFRIYPGDRLVIMGPPEELREAETMLNEFVMPDDAGNTDRLAIAELKLTRESELVGQTLADSHFRQRFNVTVVGIRRIEEQITKVTPGERFLAGDRLIVIGTATVVAQLKI